jgi:hypothetical protein
MKNPFSKRTFMLKVGVLEHDENQLWIIVAVSLLPENSGKGKVVPVLN